MDYFQECISLIEKVLKDAKMSKQQVHDVVFVGGSSRIPKIIEMVSDFFEGRSPN